MEKQKEKELYQYCLRCGRKLKTDEARQRGFGKICALKTQTGYEQLKLFENISKNA